MRQSGLKKQYHNFKKQRQRKQQQHQHFVDVSMYSGNIGLGSAAVHSKTVVLLLLIVVPIVFGPSFVMQYLVSFLVLQ